MPSFSYYYYKRNKIRKKKKKEKGNEIWVSIFEYAEFLVPILFSGENDLLELEPMT